MPPALFAMKMLRKSLILGIVLLVTGIVPVLAYGGSCDRMPCCYPKGHVVTQADASCCSPATCVRETAGIKNDVAKQQSSVGLAIAATVDRHVVTSTTVTPISFAPAEAPKATSDRLALLSTLLI